MTKRIFELTLASAVAIAFLGLSVSAQDPAPAPAQTPPSSGGYQDPFSRPPPKTVKVPEQKDSDKPVLIPFPTLDQRQAEYQQSRAMASRAGQPEPDAIGQYLVSELVVTGMFQTDEGVGAFVLATPTNNTFFAKAGTRVYNGEIVTINSGSDFGVGQVVFRELTKYRIRKKEENRVNMITKAVASPVKKTK